MFDYTTIKLPKTSKGRKTLQARLIYESELRAFASKLMELQFEIAENDPIKEDDKVSARGWAYLLEGFSVIQKDQFDYCEKIINLCRKEGYLPIDFTAQDKSREFFNVEDLTKDYEEPAKYLIKYLEVDKRLDGMKEDVAFWESQKYYIQMMVEKIDVRNLFNGICEKYHIPISNAKGWSDLLSRNELIQRFKEAEEIGLIPVLLYYGDFDPAGIKIAENFEKNIMDLMKATEWNPMNLIIDHFGLTIDFINENNILWIDNLITGGKRNLGKLYEKYKAGTLTKKEKIYDYEIQYIEQYGIRKCEANAILPIRKIAINHCEDTIQKYLGDDCFGIYDKKIKENQKEVANLMESVNFKDRIQELIDDIKNSNQDSNKIKEED